MRGMQRRLCSGKGDGPIRRWRRCAPGPRYRVSPSRRQRPRAARRAARRPGSSLEARLASARACITACAGSCFFLASLLGCFLLSLTGVWAHTHPCTVSEWLQREHCERQNPRGWCLRHRTPHRAIAASTRRALLMRHFERFEQKCLRGNRPRWVAFRRPRKLRSASRARCATSVHAKRTSTRSLPCRS